jgi:hypothetical protein
LGPQPRHAGCIQIKRHMRDLLPVEQSCQQLPGTPVANDDHVAS